MKVKGFFSILGMASVLLLAGPAFPQSKSEMRQWDRYQKMADKAVDLEKKILVFEEFINKFPENYFLQDALKKRDEIALKIAENANTLEGYKKFAMNYPQSQFLPQVLEKIAEFEFELAKKNNTVEGYYGFAENHPNSKLADQARDLGRKLEDFEAAKQLNTKEGYQAFIEKYPESELAKEAQKKIIYLARAAKSLTDLLSLFKEKGWVGTFMPNSNPAPFIEVGEYKGDGFCFLISKVNPDSESPFNKMYEKTTMDFSVNRSTRGYKSVVYSNLGSFYVILMITRESLSANLKDLSSALDLW